jgi:hypothetical protein
LNEWGFFVSKSHRRHSDFSSEVCNFMLHPSGEAQPHVRQALQHLRFKPFLVLQRYGLKCVARRIDGPAFSTLVIQRVLGKLFSAAEAEQIPAFSEAHEVICQKVV